MEGGTANLNAEGGKDLTIKGDISGKSDVRVAGTINGSISIEGELIVERQGLVEAEIKMVPNLKKDLSEEEEEKVNKFLDKLDDNDDVQNVWHNANI